MSEAPRHVGRPVGSTNGRTPDGGYPEIDAEFGGFLAGFIEGEGTFGIFKQTKHDNHRCSMSLRVRCDDRELIEYLRDRTQLGTVCDVPARANSRPQVSWSVAAKSDCRRLGQILDRFPPRGHKAHVYAIWRGALDWWIGADARAREPDRDWEPMAYLKARLGEANHYTGRRFEVFDSFRGQTADWGAYLAGFVTAEGHFGISRSDTTFRPRFALKVRADDQPLLTELCHRTRAGRVYGPYERAKWSPVAVWTVFSRGDLLTLIDAFDETPPKGRKLRDYEIWRQAAILAQSDRSPGLRGELRRAGERLRDARSLI